MTYKVIQWATGAMGKNVLRAIIDHPALDLVGVYVYGEAKAGRDAGEIARRPPTGVAATRDIDDILALQADVVIHCARIAPPYGSHDPDLLRLLRSGKNVISINGYSDPGFWATARSDALLAACKAGGTSLMAAGLNPGFAVEQVAATVTGVCSALDHVDIVECADSRAVRNPDYVFRILGFGSDPAAMDPNDPRFGPAAALNGMYSEVLSAFAKHLGLALDRVETDHALLPATEDLHVAAGTVPAGTVGHVRWRWHAVCAGTRRVTLTINWFMQTAHLDEPEPPLWRIRVTGQPGVRVAIDLDKRPGDETPTSAEQIATAGSVINAIPVVCAAPPGFVTRPIATPYRGDLA